MQSECRFDFLQAQQPPFMKLQRNKNMLPNVFEDKLDSLGANEHIPVELVESTCVGARAHAR